MKPIQRLDDLPHELDAALVRVEGLVSVEDANLIRNYIQGLQGRLRQHELIDDYSDACDDGNPNGYGERLARGMGG